MRISDWSSDVCSSDLLAEESGAQGKSRFTWVIDPLDGTSNFLRGMPHFCVSIAQMDGNEPIHAVIYDPLRNELFTATRGGGAQLNEKKIRVSERLDLNRSEEHTSELQSLMRISYAVFCLKKKKTTINK